MMNFEMIIFSFLALTTIGCAWLSVTTNNIFRAAVFLLFSLVGIAGIYFMLQYDFIAAVQIVVYVGGIVVLIIFSIFLTAQIGIDLPKPHYKNILYGFIVAMAGFLLSTYIIASNSFNYSEETTIEPTVNNIGIQMLNTDVTGMALPFEVISILLLAAMIGCIVIALKTRPEN